MRRHPILLLAALGMAAAASPAVHVIEPVEPDPWPDPEPMRRRRPRDSGHAPSPPPEPWLSDADRDALERAQAKRERKWAKRLAEGR